MRFVTSNGGLQELVSSSHDKAAVQSVLAADIIPMGEGIFGFNLNIQGVTLATRMTINPSTGTIYGITNVLQNGKSVECYTWTGDHSAGTHLGDLIAALSGSF